MSIFNVFTLMGGIAMFLYGMDLMGKALEQTAGSKLQGILSKMTASPVRGPSGHGLPRGSPMMRKTATTALLLPLPPTAFLVRPGHSGAVPPA